MTFYAQSRIHSELALDGLRDLSLQGVIARLRAWNEARITRNALNALSDRELMDVGLTRNDIEKVAYGKF